ncbi:unnamed protein product [Medioppia subpectinata]|uniref:Actin-related protein 8 n=1 Tax=Medioppia subpectinata TaxID=1979941 RepID=A0A7R9PVT4_9ACAR|nr:unnamed protein product [Medioppia subpectinata]CAG2103035.1 unnamed protein product [Medioppia subpectinata]
MDSLIAKEVTERSESKTISPSLDTECKAETNSIPAFFRSKQTLTEDTHLLPLKATNKELEKSVLLTRLQELSTECRSPANSWRSTPNGQQWTQLKGNEDVLIGEEALYLKPGQPFHTRWPIRRGLLNVSNCLGGSLTSIISDLESICGKAIEKHFEISLKELNQYRVVLIIPDVYNRSHIKYMIEMLLNGHVFSFMKHNECQKSIANVLNSCLTSSGRLRTASNTDVINNFNKRSKPIVLSKSTPNGQQWTQLKGNEDVLIGEEALYLKPGQPFHIRWPIRRGVLNVSNCLGGSLTSIIADLESICGKAIEKHFEISLKELNQYRVVLIIPDVYNRNHIKYMIEMLLNGLGFQSCLLIHEAVCATFGAGLSTACVVDVGHEKTSICCIEDGFGSRNTRLTLEYGGSDITQVFHYLLKQKTFPYECKPETRVGALFLEGLKQKLCHLNLDVCGHQETRFRVTVPEEPVLDYTILVGDECIIGPLGLFYPELFALTMNSTKRMRILYRNDGHSDDPFDENYLIQTKRKYGESNDNLGQTSESAAIEATIDDELDGCDVNPNVKEINSDQQLLGLDQAIVQCIDQCESDEVKRRMFGSILLCGGGLAFNGIDKYLRSRVSQQIPNQFRGQTVEIHVKPKDIDSQIVSWKGAAVLSLLDSAQEMWITSDEWTKSGIKLLREKASFVF